MAKIIEFLVPSSFKRRPTKWIPQEEYRNAEKSHPTYCQEGEDGFALEYAVT